MPDRIAHRFLCLLWLMNPEEGPRELEVLAMAELLPPSQERTEHAEIFVAHQLIVVLYAATIPALTVRVAPASGSTHTRSRPLRLASYSAASARANVPR